MTRPAKTKLEQQIVSAFQSTQPELVRHAITPLSPPDPDFGTVAGDESIGIELTELVARKVLRQLESEYKGIMVSARRTYLDTGSQPVSVTAYWDHFRAITKSERGELAARLAVFVGLHVPASLDYVALNRPHDAAIDWPDSRIVRIAICPVADGDPSAGVWEPDSTAAPGRARPEHIQARIDAKAGKPRKYTRSFSARWLLLWQSEGAPSSDFSVTPEVLSHTYASSFDRVFLFRLSSGRSHELRLRQQRDRAGAA